MKMYDLLKMYLKVCHNLNTAPTFEGFAKARVVNKQKGGLRFEDYVEILL